MSSQHFYLSVNKKKVLKINWIVRYRFGIPFMNFVRSTQFGFIEKFLNMYIWYMSFKFKMFFIPMMGVYFLAVIKSLFLTKTWMAI